MLLKYCLAAASAAVLLLMSGCSLFRPASDSARRYIDPEADCVRLERFHDPVLRLRQWADAVDQAIQQGKLPDRRKRELCSLLAAVRLALRQAGLTEQTVFAVSGSPEIIRGERYWKTSRVLYFGTDTPNVLLYRVVGPGRTDIAKELAACPADTLLAAAVELDPGVLADAAGPLAEAFSGSVPSGLAQALAALAGRWTLQVSPAANGRNIRLTLPDRDGAAYRFFARTLPSDRSGALQLPGFGGMPAFTVTAVSGQLILQNSTVRDDAGPMLADHPAVRERLRRLPAQGSGYIYIAPRFLQETGIPVPSPEFPELFGVLKREKDALMLNTVSSWDPVSEEYLVPAMFAGPILANSVILASDYLRNESREHADRIRCVENLQTIGRALQTYAQNHQGKFPAGNDIAGFRELLDAKLLAPQNFVCPAARGDKPAEKAEKFSYEHCSYVYIGGSDASTPGDFPLVFDWPLNHPGTFRVLFVNGKTAEFRMEKLTSCRRLASSLQSRFRYPEKDFSRLLDTADKLDVKFLKGHSR